MLAILAMLARKSALRVAAGDSAPPNPLRCAPRLGQCQVGTGKAGSPIEQESRSALHEAPTDTSRRRNPHASIDKLTWRREHSGEAMLDPLGSIPG